MMLPEGNPTKDGYTWTPSAGLQAGIPTIGAIDPPTLTPDEDVTYDVIVVGAGYSGLTAARDCAVSGLKTLLIEARDRIGGRSWSSNIDGYPYEMGGTWVHWHQPNVWRELVRYDLKKELESSHDRSSGLNHALYKGDDYEVIKSHEEVDAIWTSALDKFYTIDGKSARELMPNPHDEFSNPEVLKYDSMSVADRLNDIKGDLTPLELTAANVLVLMSSCARPEESSLFEAIKWYAMCHWNYQGMVDYLMTYKFAGGQSSFAIRFFNEAVQSGNLSYVFNAPVASIKQSSSSDGVSLTTRAGTTFRAKCLISTIPLNVLPSVTFSPSLSAGKQSACALGNVNRAAKVHIETSQTELRSWMGLNYPNNKLVFAFGDGTTPASNTHVVSFGFTHDHLQPEEDVEGTTLTAVEKVGVPREGIEKLVFHNWHKDEFAQGAWFYAPPGLVSKHLEDMRAREGNVWFASADWSVGWRSFIDGAIEEGTRCAWEVRQSLRRGEGGKDGEASSARDSVICN